MPAGAGYKMHLTQWQTPRGARHTASGKIYDGWTVMDRSGNGKFDDLKMGSVVRVALADERVTYRGGLLYMSPPAKLSRRNH